MAVLIALSFGLLFLLIAMVVNIGFLVAAKMNLQNAVDLAAYAGAAQQARYLSEIGKWNYEMRRNYKAMVFDYMIMLNGERKYDKQNATPPNQDFKDYVTDSSKQPLVCASLQRQGSNQSSQDSLTNLCQPTGNLDFQTALTNSLNALTASGTAALAACISGGDPTTCTSVATAYIATSDADNSVTNAAIDHSNLFANYEPHPYNYNRRLIAWMLHDYRHLQSRIRGVHFGDIKIGTYPSGGRWALAKDPNTITVFKNSPISVAAKVLNGYTAIDGKPPTGNILPLKDDQLKNPVHNAAYTTFKKNLIKVLADTEAKPSLYHLVPKIPAAGSSQGMVGGCGGKCPEYNGAYLRLDSHDVNFTVNYLTIKEGPTNQYVYGVSAAVPVTYFPVGVAKDMRVKTYYTVVGTASTKKIPFNVFFGDGPGDNTPSQEATLVAVAAARPFGSRIGPYINADCENLFSGANRANCEKNGLDYLYPFNSSPLNLNDLVPNFSLQTGNRDKTEKLGVKLCVNTDEYQGSKTNYPLWGVTNINADTHAFIYQITHQKRSRWRIYTKIGDRNSDDGFPSRPTNLSSNPSNYYDSDNTATHPLGTRDSVVAWSNKYTEQTLNASQKNNYETYLDKYKGGAIYQFDQIQGRESDDNQPYKVYVFKYPEPMKGNPEKGWDYTNFNGTTSVQPATTAGGSMIERAFANAMSVNQFEIMRYIIPYRNANQQSSLDLDVMNFADLTKNKETYVFGGLGASGRNKAPATMLPDNVPFGADTDPGTNNMVKSEGTGEVFGVSTKGDLFPETYAAWRFGTRGYRVKLVNIQDLLIIDNQTFQNPLEASYTLPDQDVTIDLSKIKY